MNLKGVKMKRCQRCGGKIPADAEGRALPHSPCEPVSRGGTGAPRKRGDVKALERDVLADLQALGMTKGLRPQHQFHPVRKWRFDFAYPRLKLALEVHGGTYQHFQKGNRLGAHSYGPTQRKDFEKWSEAAVLGWRVLHVDAIDVRERLHVDRLQRAIQGMKH